MGEGAPIMHNGELTPLPINLIRLTNDMPKGIYIRTQEHKDNTRKALTGYKQTDEHKRNTGKAMISKNKGRKSKPFTQQRKDNIKKSLAKNKYKRSGKNHPLHGKVGKDNPTYGAKNGNWKGGHSKLRCTRMHAWVIQNKSKASNYKCIDCGKQALDWSNVDHLYKKILDDYRPRCRSCHQLYDKRFN